jgi:ATP-dependent Clp protease adaptor protein ClpS
MHNQSVFSIKSKSVMIIGEQAFTRQTCFLLICVYNGAETTVVFCYFYAMKPNVLVEEEVELLEVVETIDTMELVVFNDDVNTFDHVINTLIRVCKHSIEQAEQCTWLIHYKGKCTVKSGTFDYLKPYRDAICEAGIDAKIL